MASLTELSAAAGGESLLRWGSSFFTRGMTGPFRRVLIDLNRRATSYALASGCSALGNIMRSWSGSAAFALPTAPEIRVFEFSGCSDRRLFA